MILRFSVENYRSFRDASELSLVSTARKDEPSWCLPSRHAKHGILPVLGLWGANASGKSNILAALLEMRRLVRDSFIKFGPGEPVPWSPWRERRGAEDPPTRMELDLLLADDVRIQFGFSFTAEGFAEEWMYRWVGARRQVLYERSPRGGDEAPWYFGSSLKGPRGQIAAATRKNSLFLSTAAQHNHPVLLPIFSKIVEMIVPEEGVKLQGHPIFDIDSPLLADELRPALMGLLKAADLGVVDFKVEPYSLRSPEPPELPEQIFHPDFLKKMEDYIEGQVMEIHFVHGSPDDPWGLSPLRESRGTHVLLARLADFLPLLQTGGTLIVDEIDTSLHPDLCAVLVGLFTDERSNPHGAQLIFSTHDRGLLSYLRTDEVVMVDKERSGASHLVPASDYRGLRTRDDLRRAHEQGQIRGVPVLGDLAGLLAAEVRGDAGEG